MVKNDITDEGYDFNGWILEFFQENCNGIVQIDGQGFYSPKGELVVDMEEAIESGQDVRSQYLSNFAARSSSGSVATG